jgi:hypothetical protein
MHDILSDPQGLGHDRPVKPRKLGSAAPDLEPSYFSIISGFYRFIFRISVH